MGKLHLYSFRIGSFQYAHLNLRSSVPNAVFQARLTAVAWKQWFGVSLPHAPIPADPRSPGRQKLTCLHKQDATQSGLISEVSTTGTCRAIAVFPLCRPVKWGYGATFQRANVSLLSIWATHISAISHLLEGYNSLSSWISLPKRYSL